MKTLSSLLLLLFAVSCFTKTAEEWKSRVIYQIVTDRFAPTKDNIEPCTDLTNYCGGTFKGIEKNLDYIQGLGANAIWISPVIKNAPGGYHGYWHTNFYEINENFGTKQDLLDLISACHERDIWVMADVVANHVADVPNRDDFSSIYPFNDKSHYHWPVCLTQDVDEFNPTNQTGLEVCWLSYLPDLNHENEFVANTLLEWVKDFVDTYQMDGLRIDATRHVPKWFWHKYSEAAGVFTVGEVWNHDVPYVGGYQGPLDSLLNFPFHGFMDQAYKNHTKMTVFRTYFQETIHLWPDPTVVVNFQDNHDMARCLFNEPNAAFCKAAYALVLSIVGIPVIYYGDEQSFNGGPDPANREPLWGKMDTDSDMYQFFRTITTFRERTGFYKEEQIQRLADEAFYAFSRGMAFFAVTNSEITQRRVITSHPYAEGTILCNIMSEKDCTEVRQGGFEVTLSDMGVKILYPHGVAEKEKVKIPLTVCDDL